MLTPKFLTTKMLLQIINEAEQGGYPCDMDFMVNTDGIHIVDHHVEGPHYVACAVLCSEFDSEEPVRHTICMSHKRYNSLPRVDNDAR